MRRVLVLVSTLLLLAATAALAQNTDMEALSGVQFNFANPGARSLAMGGAFLGLADDASAAEANPAGLTILRRPEISVEGRNYENVQTFTTGGVYPDALTTEDFNNYSRRAQLSFASIVLPMGNFAVAGYYHQPLDYQILLETASSAFTDLNPVTFYLGPNGPVSSDQCANLGADCLEYNLNPFGSVVDVSMKTAGVALAWKMGNLSLGVAGRYQKFNETALTLRADPNGNLLSIIAQQAKDEHDTTFTGGFKWAPSDRFSLGGVYKQGPSFKTDLSFADLTTSNGFQHFANPMFHVPDIAGVGISYRPIPVLTINVDVDDVMYSNLVDDMVVINPDPQLQGKDFKMDDATEVHVGGEYFFATKIPFAVRAGWWRDPAHQMKYSGPLQSAEQVAAAIIFPGGQDENHYSVGFGLAWPRFQVDAAYETSDRYKVGSVSIVTRF
ncbi:MAG: hypothetical protein WBX15_02370 [Thermoanaerobaculia bacterium]